jgi:hypothetical protein
MIAPRDPRRARLASIRRQIADGTYETPDKLAAAIDAWLEQHEATCIESIDCDDAPPPESPSEQLRRRKPK